MRTDLGAALLAIGAAGLLLLGGCGSTPPSGSPRPFPTDRDGPLPNPPADLERVPDAEPRVEPIRPGGANKPYAVDGKRYEPLTSDAPLKERGLASWYGRKFHGRPTASGEIYNMYAMTAAHPTMPLPSYARVRNPANGKEVIVRVNDRGPFHSSRVIDLSYTAALKLGLLRGVGIVELERITNDDIRSAAWRRPGDATAVAAAAAAMPPERASTTAAPAQITAEAIPGAPSATGSAPASIAAARSATAVASGSPPSVATGIGSASTTADAASSGATATASGSTSARATVQAATMPASSTAATPAVSPVTAGPAEATAAAATAAPSAPSTDAQPSPATADPARAAAAPEAPPRSDARPLAVTVATAPTPAARGYWVQLGAFRQRDGAISFQQRVTAELAWLAPLLAVFNDAPVHRLQAGPYASKEEAGAIAERVRDALKLVPVIVERR